MPISLCIISERWVDANPLIGFSTNEGNVYQSAIQSGLFSKVDHLFIDKYKYETGNHIDEALMGLEYDLFYISFLGDSFLNPSPKSLVTLKGKIVFNWPDTVWPWIYHTTSLVNRFATCHFAHDLPSDELKLHLSPKKIHTIGTPQDLRYFRALKAPEAKVFDVSFMGYQYGDRPLYVSYLKEHFQGSYYFGNGSRAGSFSYEDYGTVMRQSRICINFTSSPAGVKQLKGRAFEAAACNSFLLEEENPYTGLMFEKGKEFDTFTDRKDLLDKINYYLARPDLMTAMSNAAHKRYMENYSPVPYWNKVLSLV